MSKLLAVMILALPLAARADEPAPTPAAAAAPAAATGAASPAKPADEREDLLKMADLIANGYTDETWTQAVSTAAVAGSKLPASRRDALRAVYAKLAELDYKDSLKTGPAVEQKPQVQAALETVDAGLLIETGWGDWASHVYEGLSQSSVGSYHSTWHGNAVAAVRGGRAVTADDAELSGLAAEMQKTDDSLKDSALTPEKRAALLYERGRLFNRLAQVSKADAPPAQLSPKEIYEKFSPAVVVIVAMGKDGKGELGTGSIIDAQGRVLTNAHVVTRDADARPYESVKVFLKPETITGDSHKDLKNAIAMRVARFDRALDLALLEPATPYAPKATIAFGSSAGVEPGEPVVAIGHPEQGGLWTLTTGVVSTILADLGGVKGKDVFQTDASINRGNSGGPLLNRQGQLIGVNTSMARKASDGLTITSVNFSIKSAVAQKWLSSGESAAAAAAAAPVAEEVAQVVTPKPAPIAAPAPVAAQAAAKPAIVTPAKPYRVESLLEDEREKDMKEMDDLEKEMREDVEKGR